MKVVLLSDHYLLGGAAQATNRIRESLRQYHDLDDHHTIHHVAFFPDEPENWVFRLKSLLWYEESAAKRQLYRIPRKLLPSLFPRPHTPAFAAARLQKVLQELQPDLINVHNLHSASAWGWGPALLEVCLDFAPVVWTLHDMWSFTGRCAYSYDCEKFIDGCDAACPTHAESPTLAPAEIRAAWEQRRTIYDRHLDNLTIVTPSQWLASEARRGLFAQYRIEVIPYGVPSRQGWFFPYPREEARRQLGIHPAGPVLLISAVDLTERRKGAEILPHVWRSVQHRPLTVLLMGHGTVAIDDPLIEVHSLGWLDDYQTKALAYSAADALLHPAPVDNLPNVVLEAFACGTPVIAMPVGGLPEMVRPGISGWLAQSATPAALGQAVDRAIHDLTLGKGLRESCRRLAEKEYGMELQGERYFHLFKELLSRPQHATMSS